MRNKAQSRLSFDRGIQIRANRAPDSTVLIKWYLRYRLNSGSVKSSFEMPLELVSEVYLEKN